ncbi:MULTISPECIES: enoyl-CoA hydratase-related protein [unclassified Minwuia]|jgi:2-(1,2-epoxy-1,2-dihydrophenyl)acetyl-CoA isomerase|uniref:enoyl-CoA hydratase/isomerase family protein n=1 Tax=unclassified Minwuia TaxID=2618799 RepID=UPI00247A3160|nr:MULTISPECIES: enoyl-CoA hydratase-related protein [unclassified Minwuia]
MTEATVLWAMDGDVATITLNRPKAKNSLRPEDLAELVNCLEAVENAGARCMIMRGAGGAFSAGRDIAGADPASDDNEALLRDVIHPVLLAVRALDIPTIALIEGPCLGVGFGLAFACDIQMAADNAVLGSPFRNIGCILDSGGHYHMQQRIGTHRTFELIYTGRLISGQEAADMGLINHAFAPDALEEEVLKMARHIATGPTKAFAISKRILRDDLDLDASLTEEARGQDEACKAADGVEGFKAFQEKRRPVFKGA